MCPGCWLDSNLEVFDPEEVFKFLQRWYWPINDKPTSSTESTLLADSKSSIGMLEAIGFIIALTCCVAMKRIMIKIISLQRKKDMKRV